MTTPTEVQTHQADGYVERDPGDLTISEMYGHTDDDSEIVPESCDSDEDDQ